MQQSPSPTHPANFTAPIVLTIHHYGLSWTHRHGVRLITRQIAPGMVQQMQQQCPACDGKGTTIKPKDRCTDCSGKKTKSEKKVDITQSWIPDLARAV